MLWLGRQRHDGVALPSLIGVVRVVLMIGLVSNFAMAQQDTSPPVCTVVNRTQNTWTLQATDETGVRNVTLLPGSVNLRLNVANITTAVPSITFTVERIVAGQAGNGIVNVIDGNNAVNTTISFAAISDTTVPVCNIIATTRNVLTLQAFDNNTSEDVNGNGQIDSGEDKNSNGVLDVSTGIASVTLQPNSTNMILNVPTFTRGVSSLTFTINRNISNVAGSGVVIVTDVANNTVNTAVTFASITDTISPVCNVLVRGQNIWTIRATDNATEDANGNGRLDPGEDKNSNSLLDIDTGVSSVTLLPGSTTNVQLIGGGVGGGVASRRFNVSRINAGQVGSGTVVVKDVAGNNCTVAVVFATPTRDPYDPVITIVSKGRNSWTLRANDDEPSEDVNGNGVLDGDEDANGNGLIDGDSGVANVTIQTGSSNVRLTVANFTPGVASVRFTVSRITGGQAGSGVVVVRDVAGNSKTQAVAFAATNDPYNPVCSVLRKGQNTWSLRATDNEPSEDENGNGVLDNQEDSNGNGVIDTDTGIASVVLQPGSTNVKLNVAPFVSGVGSIQFTVDRNITGVAGSGTVVVKDQEGNQCTLTVAYDPTNDPYPPVVTVLSKGQTTWTLLATDNRTSEDVNRNGQLDNNEDKNNNGVIDQDTGIASITLQSNTNLRLNVANFDPGVSTIQFTVDRIGTLVDGIGTLVVRDVAGNTNRTSILIPVIDRTPGVTGDSFKPVCTVVSRGANTWVLRGTDNKPSEDVNGNNQLDTGEDTNANGIIDEDTGIASVVLVSGSTNVQLNVPTTFVAGDPSIRVTVDRITAGQAGSGTVRITDGGGNLCTLAVTFGVPAGRIYNDAYNPVCTVLTKGRTRWSARATDKRRGEDLNRNGRIDADEDANDNGLIDGDSGIKSVVLKSGSSNVRLNVTPFTPGARTVNFTVERVSKRRSRGRGTVLVTDRAGHTCTVPVRLNKRRNMGNKRGKGRGFIRSTGKKDRGKVKRTLRGIVH